MTPDGYKNLIDAANESIPFYTTHLETLRKLIDVQSKTTEYFVQVDPNIDLEEFNEIEQMNKFNALLTISLLDLMVVCKNMCLAKTDWERIHFIKHGYLVVYETINTYHKHSSELQRIIATKYAAFRTSFESINKDLKQFKKLHDYEKVIGLIRNKVAGHIDEDFVLYYDIIAKLDGEKVALTISHFIQILTQLQNLSEDLASHANAVIQNKGELVNKSLMEKLKQIEELFAKFEKSS